MVTSRPFDAHHERYEAWFARHPEAYTSELLALRALLPWRGLGLEIGVGTGRFAAPLGVRIGLDPSRVMMGHALLRGVQGIQGTAEDLPFRKDVFDYALVVTTICFVEDPRAMLREARRVLRPRAPLVIGFVDRNSPLGRHYVMHQAENVFYREATFYSAAEVSGILEETGFGAQTWAQTLLTPLGTGGEIEPLLKGHGKGGFVVVSAIDSG